MSANPIYTDVPGAPVSIGTRVTITAIEDPEDNRFLNLQGVVKYLDYECGCGQNYPNDPMIGVSLNDGTEWEFWMNELSIKVD